MIGVITGFSVIWAVILGGYVIGRYNLLGHHAPVVLSRLVYFVGTPALMLVNLSRTDVHAVFSSSLVVAAVSAIASAGLYLLIARVFWRRSGISAVVGSMGASLVNASNLGIPIAVYVLGSASFAAPVLIFQLAFFTPLFFTLMDVTASGRPASLRGVGRQLARNPILIASLLGLTLAITGWHPPDLVLEPFQLLGGVAVPGALLAFGVSMYGSKVLEAGDSRPDVLLAAISKLVFQPLAAFLAGHYLLGLEGHALFSVVVMAGLPSAQNVFVAAARFESGVAMAKDIVLITTVVAIPALMGVAALLA
ncbi:AEC family transporter [Paenarthrobacter sp. DKR-5]|uniref:AEC family transporter n=1 Tax=Paenarthrobacter sp. DKR-5 TaxID=2835535 RepID=UPI001BDDBCFD|nr:AEC family transporter [Paenarthrobacter sp. DKR-5]MBT1001469.1 AEC family transporter [Paenarthrobacter sp. DKR-5]